LICFLLTYIIGQYLELLVSKGARDWTYHRSQEHDTTKESHNRQDEGGLVETLSKDIEHTTWSDTGAEDIDTISQDQACALDQGRGGDNIVYTDHVELMGQHAARVNLQRGAVPEDTLGLHLSGCGVATDRATSIEELTCDSSDAVGLGKVSKKLAVGNALACLGDG
jgi:hypothetical protein